MMKSNDDVKITIDEIVDLLKNPKNSGTNQILSDCPYCSKQKHFYLNKTNFFWDCKKCKESGNIRKLLRHFGILEQFLHKTLKLDKLLLINNDDEEDGENITLADLPKKSLPRGYQRIFNHPYLKNRGLITNDFYKYNIGISKTSRKLDKYIIMLIEEDGECKGYVSRCMLSKEEIEKYDLLRYRNSLDTKFNSLLFGYEEITRNTRTVIIVEGIFDKIRLDNILKTSCSEDIKVVCTFGNKVSQNQLNKLRVTSVEKIVLFYDLDAIEEMKKTSPKIKKYFDLKICCLLDGKDPGDASEQEVLEALFNEYDSNSFFYEKCNGRKLKI